jgi:hypothetical protein
MAENLIALAISRMPPPVQEQAAEILRLSAEGYGTVEIGSQIGLTWRKVNETTRLVGDSLVRVLVEEEGYTEIEAIRLLRVPSYAIVEALPERFPSLAAQVIEMSERGLRSAEVAQVSGLSPRAVSELASASRSGRYSG